MRNPKCNFFFFLASYFFLIPFTGITCTQKPELSSPIVPKQPTIPKRISGFPDRIKLAIIDFKSREADGSIVKLKSLLPDLLISHLSKRGSISIVERERLEEVREELSLQTSGAVDDDQTVKIGKFSGATVLLFGNIFGEKLGMVRVESRLVDVQNGEILGTYSATGEKTDYVGLATQLSLQILSSLGVRLEPSEEFFLEVTRRYVRQRNHESPKEKSNFQTQPDVNEAKGLILEQLGPSMVPADELEGVALLTNVNAIWPGTRNGMENWPESNKIIKHFLNVIDRELRQTAQISMIRFSSLTELKQNPPIIALIPQVTSVFVDWDCPWYRTVECIVMKNQYYAKVKGRLMVLDFRHQTYWLSTEVIGWEKAGKEEQAILYAYTSIIRKWVYQAIDVYELSGKNLTHTKGE